MLPACLISARSLASCRETDRSTGGGSGEFAATLYNLVSIWVERHRQKISKEKELPEDELVKELRQKTNAELRLDYLVTGSQVPSINPLPNLVLVLRRWYRWSLKASQEALRLLGPKYVNLAIDARTINEGKFGKIPEESTWNLSPNPAMVYLCENEVCKFSLFHEISSC